MDDHKVHYYTDKLTKSVINKIIDGLDGRFPIQFKGFRKIWNSKTFDLPDELFLMIKGEIRQEFYNIIYKKSKDIILDTLYGRILYPDIIFIEVCSMCNKYDYFGYGIFMNFNVSYINDESGNLKKQITIFVDPHRNLSNLKYCDKYNIDCDSKILFNNG